MPLSRKLWMALTIFSISLNDGMFVLFVGLGGRRAFLGIGRINNLLVGSCHVFLIYYCNHLSILSLESSFTSLATTLFLALWRSNFVVTISSAITSMLKDDLLQTSVRWSIIFSQPSFVFFTFSVMSNPE